MLKLLNVRGISQVTLMLWHWLWSLSYHMIQISVIVSRQCRLFLLKVVYTMSFLGNINARKALEMFSARFYNVKYTILMLIFTATIVVYYITREGTRYSTKIFYNFCQSNNMWSYWYQCDINVFFNYFKFMFRLCLFLLSISHAESLPSTHWSHWHHSCISSKCSWSL